MNRLVIVGNGFDLAHGMKTGYNDFILYYLSNAFSAFLKNGTYHDELLEIKPGTRGLFNQNLDGRTVTEFIYSYYSKGKLDVLLQQQKRTVTISSFSDRPRSRDVPYHIKISSSILSAIASTCSITNWVDLENLYYDELKKALDDKNKQQQQDVINLNISLRFLVDQLQIYLSTITSSNNLSYNRIFTDPVQTSEVLGLSSLEPLNQSIDTSQSLILNFNYTKTPEKYIDPDSIIYIHGRLNDSINSIVFGFGDELDADYSRLEISRIKEVFNYIKSFWYFKTSNYHDLIRFIESEQFQVRIVGHSCGLSDRTMLNMIFEHANCLSIKIFYHQRLDGSNNYTELTQEISRHFKNKQSMRMKIVPFDKSKAMPQISS